ncbi:hypothetical protein VPH35_091293 [Triticum aestivum]
MAAAAAFLGVREGNAVPSSVLLELFGRIGPARNATTATSTTSTGHPIAVTLCGARPPVLSHFSVDFAARPDPDDLSLAPKVVSTDADLVLLRVPVRPHGWYYQMFSDYFVYRARPRRPTLDLLPKSAPHYFGDNEIAVLSCAGGDGEYAVAALKRVGMVSFKLHLYRSGPDGEPGSWTSRRTDEEQMLRDATPPSSEMLMSHLTTKVITLGGAKGTVGWVDLWRGILLCDLLDESPAPVLRDMPLPSPLKGDWTWCLERCPYYLRDIAVNERKDAIKYVEVTMLVDDTWKATTWSMPIPATSWSHWRQRCSVWSARVGVPADVARHYRLLHKLMSGRAHKAAEGVLSLGRLRMALPTMGVADEDDDVVYMLAEATSDGAMTTVLAVDLGTQALRGVAKLKRRRLGFTRGFLVTGVMNLGKQRAKIRMFVIKKTIYETSKIRCINVKIERG